MPIHIHIGIGKTGTTAIQHFLYCNRMALSEQGFIYPDVGIVIDGHHHLAVLGCQELPKATRLLYCEIRDLLDCNPSRNVVISSENFCFMSPGYVREVLNLFRDHVVNVYMYVRQQRHLVESVFLHFQKVGNDYRGNINDFFRFNKHAFDFNLRIAAWSDALGDERIFARIYDKKIIGADIREDFLRFLGFTESIDFGENLLINESIIPDFAELISIVDKNQQELSYPGRNLFISELLLLSKKFGKQSQFSLMTEELATEIYNRYRDSNAAFAARFLDAEQGRLLCEPD